MGFPIRKSTGQRLFAPHRSLSQRTTSFIASYCQGIHQMPLGRLIALISNAHPSQCWRSYSNTMTRQVNNAQKDQKIYKTNPQTTPRSRASSGEEANRLLERRPVGVDERGHISSSRCFRLNRQALRPAKLVALSSWTIGNGGASRDRTDDLKLAKLPLSQLSYGPISESRLVESIRSQTTGVATMTAQIPRPAPAPPGSPHH